MKLFHNLFSKKDNFGQVDAQNPETEYLKAKAEAQSLRLDLEAAHKQSEKLNQEIDRLRMGQQEILELQLTTRMEALFTEVSGPASQILTQVDLVEKQGKPVQIADVLAVAKRMIRALERNGLEIINQPGDRVAFDPSKHTSLNQIKLDSGQPAVVRFAGVSYQHKTIHKAFVEAEQRCPED